MTPQDILNAKSKLDAELKQKSKNVGIAFGPTLFAEFVKAGHIVKKPFGFLGTTIWTESLPAYDTHYAFADWDVTNEGFKVGNG